MWSCHLIRVPCRQTSFLRRERSVLCWAATIVSLDGSWSCPGNASGSRINHSLTCPDGRQTTFGEAFSKHHYYLTKSGTWRRTFHIAQVPIHRDVSRDSDVQPMLKNLVMPSSNYDGSEVVLFLDETSHNLRFISGPFSLSNSRHWGKVGIDALSGTTRLATAVRNNVKPVTPLKRWSKTQNPLRLTVYF